MKDSQEHQLQNLARDHTVLEFTILSLMIETIMHNSNVALTTNDTADIK